MRVAQLAFLVCLPLFALGQNLSVPSTWANTSSFFTRDERSALAQGAIHQYIMQYPSGSMASYVASASVQEIGQSIPMLSLFARKDLVTTSGGNQGYVVGELDALIRNDSWLVALSGSSNGGIPLSDYALACLSAYRAYGNTSHLQKANALWAGLQSEQLRILFASEPIICNGSSLGGAITLPGASTFGNIFLESWDTTSFLQLSAQLAELSDTNSTVLMAANLAAQASETFMTTSDRPPCLRAYLALQATGPGSNDCRPVLSGGAEPTIDCSMTFGASALALSEVTKNASTQQTFFGQVANYMHSPWLPKTGIINETLVYGYDPGLSALSSKNDLVLSLADVWNRSLSAAPELAQLLSAFMNVQLNALMSNATISGSNLYGTDWSGPPAKNFTVQGMSGGIAALVAAISPASNVSSTPTSSVQTSPTTSSTSTVPAGQTGSGVTGTPLERRGISHGAIIGIGCTCAALAVLLLGCLVWRVVRTRRRSSSGPEPFRSGADNDPTVLVIREKEATMLWRGQSSAELDREAPEPLSPLYRALRRKQARDRQRATSSATSASEQSPVAAQMAEDVQRLLRRAESLPDTSAADLRRRVEELGPIPEVIEAIQEILRTQNVPDGELPRYEEEHQRA